MENSVKGKVAAIVPALDEEANIADVLKVLINSKHLDEIIVVDDGSMDKTAEIGERMGVKVVKLPKIGGSGKGNAMRQGLKATDAEIIAFFDADLIGLSEEHVSLLVEPMLKGNIEMCVGIRDRLSGWPQAMAQLDPMLAIAGERAIKKTLLEKIPDKFTKGFAIESALNYYCFINDLPIKHVLLAKIDHVLKEKKWGFFRGSWQRAKLIFQVAKIRAVLFFKFFKRRFING